LIVFLAAAVIALSAPKPHRWYEAEPTRGQYVERLCLRTPGYITPGDRINLAAWEAAGNGYIPYCQPVSRVYLWVQTACKKWSRVAREAVVCGCTTGEMKRLTILLSVVALIAVGAALALWALRKGMGY
jgi:hypothetical protein